MGNTASIPKNQKHPKQELNMSCSLCGKPAIIFESFISSGALYELVGAKVSEMMAFLASNSENVRCLSCAQKHREEQEREARYWEKQNERTQELIRTASLKSNRSDATGRTGTGSLRRKGSRGFLARMRDSWFEDEDY